MPAPNREQMLKDFVAKNPSDPFPRYGLALEYKNSGRRAEAAQVFADLMAAHPDYTAAYLHAGNNLLEQGDRSGARAVFERGVDACRKKGDHHALSELEGALDAL
jgi:tetratricopeptide (TPR) repeat protein